MGLCTFMWSLRYLSHLNLLLQTSHPISLDFRFVITTFFVLLQCRATVKRTLTSCTDIWSCICMAIVMGYKMSLVDKTFATIVTNE